MKHPDHNAEELLKTFLGSLGNASQDTIEASRDRLSERFQAGDQLAGREGEETPRRRRARWVMAAVAASVLAVVGIAGIVAFRNPAGPVVAVAENETKIVTLRDGSRLNMRPGSELSFYRAGDREEGDRCIQLVRGDVVVNAAKQEAGHHLCVQTKDFIVTVIGTVFTVSVEERGSSVIVEEGTVWVQQGSIRKTLVAGVRFSTIAAEPEAAPQVSALTAGPPQTRATAKPSLQSFEVISIKKSPPSQIRDGLRGGEVWAGLRLTNTTLKDLVLKAYDLQVFQVSGGPAWINNDRFDVETRIGNNVRVPSMSEPLDVLIEHKEKLLLMMQDMLATRFRLKVRRTTEQSAAYALVLAGKTSKLQAVSELRPGYGGAAGYNNTATMTQLAQFLSGIVGQPVVDRTGLPGLYDIKLEFVPEFLKERLDARGNSRGADTRGRGMDLDGPDLLSALKDQLGLKLEATKAPVEFFVIESVEKPSEN